MMFNVKLLPTPHNNISNIDFFIFKSVSGSAKSPKRASEKVKSFLPQVLTHQERRSKALSRRDRTDRDGKRRNERTRRGDRIRQKSHSGNNNYIHTITQTNFFRMILSF